MTTAASVKRRDGKRTAPVLSVVVPTRNEMGSVPVLLGELERVLAPTSAEVIFVDDSDDATPAVIQAAALRPTVRIRMIHRPPARRGDGLGGAVVEGIRAAVGEWICVMDADMQHPPRVIEQMLDQASRTAADIVVATRFSGEGSVGDFGALRRLLSRASRASAHFLFPLRLRSISDPMSGFFLVRREALDLAELRPRGFKVLLEILLRTPQLRASEVPFVFGERHAGRSKASLRESLRYLGQLVRLRMGTFGARVGSFGLVGATGLLVNSVLLAAFTEVAGVHYLLGAVLATQGSTAWNFWLSDRLVFAGRNHRRGWTKRLALFAAVNNIALALRAPLLLLLTSELGLYYLVSNALTLVVLFVVRFALADTWIWSGKPRKTRATFDYDIHGVLSVQSERPLPELERFRVTDPLVDPSIRVRIGRVAAATRGDRDRMSYREWGRLGFGVDIEMGQRIDVVASRLVGRSPHVLYTNVVEPILRWRMVERGYALIHGACFAVDGEGFLVTARTDTGKTTTVLKVLDREPHGFLSDDLTLVAPDGSALSYPKPLTISRHTVSSVKKPLLSRGERIALILQSRLHSRSGRRLALLIAKAHLPAATINAIVQLLVPPPKYDIARLVPRCDVVRDARVAGMMVIQRGGRGNATVDPENAIDVLMLNCEDAFGFPPYRQIEDFLHSRNGADLCAAERRIAALALAGCSTTLLRSETMDWWERIPAVVERARRTAGQSRDWSLAALLDGTRRTNGAGASSPHGGDGSAPLPSDTQTGG